MTPFLFAPPTVEWSALGPMIALALAGIIALVVESAWPRRRNDLVSAIALAGVLIAGAALILLPPTAESAFGGVLRLDAISRAGQGLVLLSTGLVLLFSEGYLRRMRISFGEFYPLLLWSALGALILCVSSNLLVLFLGIEILSLALYALAGMSRGEAKSEESALKYFLLGAFATCFFLFGTVLLYGATGTLDLARFGAVWAADAEGDRTLLIAGSALVFVGLGFKSSFVPFHQWTPDVYQGAPTNVGAFMATAAKIGPFVALWRVFEGAEAARTILLPVAAAVAVLTMTFGNVMALGQRDLRRLMGYSSVANAGYVLAAIVGHYGRPAASDASTLFTFLLGYVATTVGVFAIATLAAREGSEPGTLDSLRGLNRRAPFAFFALVVLVLSQIGIPPTVGFLGKALIIVTTLRGGYGWLGVVVALNSIVSVAYYFAIVQAAYAGEEGEERPLARATGAVAFTSAVCVAGVIGIVLFFSPLAGALGWSP